MSELENIAGQNMGKENEDITLGILVGAAFSSRLYEGSDDASLDELSDLFETAGGKEAARVLQKRPVPDAATFIGQGRAEELAKLIKNTGAELVVVDNELSPTQIRNLEEITETRVIDRSMLILDIFAIRAKTREGMLQVELAQYKYQLPRLAASYIGLSRLGGGGGGAGIGARRGSGETKLEADRRYIRNRIAAIEAELKTAKKTRQLQREGRKKGNVLQVSVIGYTNAGKSTLFNLLTSEDVLAENKLFATLDPVTRKMKTPDGDELLITDTVGFIRKLPHHLVAAFKSTLEELCYADLLLHMVDISNLEYREHERVVRELVAELGAAQKPMITVYNKCDLVEYEYLPRGEDVVCISAKSGEGVPQMLEKVIKKLKEGSRELTLIIPYANSGILDLVFRDGKVIEKVYESGHIMVRCVADKVLQGRVRDYIKQD